MNDIVIEGAKENNLKSINLTIPKNKMTVITGVSGSGKSSLAYDILHAEGQRRYLESLSSSARQYISKVKKPEVDNITGLSPTIAIDQRQRVLDYRATVGTMSDIYDYLKILYARIGIQHCITCNSIIRKYTEEEVAEQLLSLPDETRIAIFAPLESESRKKSEQSIDELNSMGYRKFRINGEIIEISKTSIAQIDSAEVIVDRIIISENKKDQLRESIRNALKINPLKIIIAIYDKQGKSIEDEHTYFFQNACSQCGIVYDELQINSFSFNNPLGACKECSGVGNIWEYDIEKLIPDKSLSFNKGGIVTVNPKSTWNQSIYQAFANFYNISLDTPIGELPDDILYKILYGSSDTLEVQYQLKSNKSNYEYVTSFNGVVNDLKKRYKESKSDDTKRWLETFMKQSHCPSCQGKRLNAYSLSVTLAGKNIIELSRLTINQIKSILQQIKITEKQKKIAQEPLYEIILRLQFLQDVGLGYLDLDRSVLTLSGGEYQRIRLATQIRSGLDGVIYILDEPTIGLHPRDNYRLIQAILKLKEAGNTVIVVEHDEQTMRKADYIIELGYGAGKYGGEVIMTGTVDELEISNSSLTGKYLSGKKVVAEKRTIRSGNGEYISIQGAQIHNLKNVNVKIPLHVLTIITGVSGSGKSSLMLDVLYPAIKNSLETKRKYKSNCKDLSGIEHIDKIIYVDQTPIGKSTRSNPATYLGFFDKIRSIYANTYEAKQKGFNAGYFSFNVEGGRCENCKGTGSTAVNMHFLPDVNVTCDVCEGKRFKKEILEIKYNQKNIYEVLEMSINEAYDFFAKIKTIQHPLKTLKDIGLDYLKLGQSSATLSGGESQRIKLASELSRINEGHTLYLLDEPTTGLHFDDIKKLMKIIHQLVDNNNTVILIEHNTDVIKQADYIIDMGPEGGAEGGEIIYEGNIEGLKKKSQSYTAHFIK